MNRYRDTLSREGYVGVGKQERVHRDCPTPRTSEVPLGPYFYRIWVHSEGSCTRRTGPWYVFP